MPDILILSPYDCLSHRYWREGLAGFLEQETGGRVTTVTLPARHFSWRHRGNSLTLSRDPALGHRPDLVIATSMTDLSALRGLNRHVASVPVIVYFHENEFAFPNRSVEGWLERQVTSIYTALSADALVFNSAFNRDTFLAGARELLARMPDGVPAGVLDTTQARVIPVALAREPVLRSRDGRERPIRIVWNHRWEHDKNPALLLEIVRGLIADGRPFEMSLLGERFRNVPPAMQEVTSLLERHHCLGVNRFIEDRSEYRAFIAKQDIVLSTASQEFQGLAVQEAIGWGCVPVVPDALVYPEYVPSAYRFENAAQAVQLIREPPPGFPNDGLNAYSWTSIGPAWIDLIRAVM